MTISRICWTAVFRDGYLDMSTGRLILSDEGLQEEAPPAPSPTSRSRREDVLDMNDDDAVLGKSADSTTISTIRS